MDVVPSSASQLLVLAARGVWAALHAETLPAPEPDPSGGGAFVTLRYRGELAGCIGYVDAGPPLSGTVLRAAEGAVLRDPRFPRLGPEHVPELEVELSLLSDTAPIGADEIRPGTHGVTLESSRGHGLLLPQVALEHGLDRLGFLTALAQKAGLPEDAWRDPDVRLRAFTVTSAAGPLVELVDLEGADG